MLQLGTDGKNLTNISLEENKLTLTWVHETQGKFQGVDSVHVNKTHLYYDDIFITYEYIFLLLVLLKKTIEMYFMRKIVAWKRVFVFNQILKVKVDPCIENSSVGLSK